jgi:hypothetical protein
MAKGPKIMNAMMISAAPLGVARQNRTMPGTRSLLAAWGARRRAAQAMDEMAWHGMVQTGLAQARLQLTRRGRLILLGIPAIALAAVMVFASLAILLGSRATPAHASVTYAAVDMADYAFPVTVLEGDSLWSIAAASNPHRDVRDVVSEIVALNELTSGVIQAGQRLYIPFPR